MRSLKVDEGAILGISFDNYQETHLYHGVSLVISMTFCMHMRRKVELKGLRD